VTRFCLFFCMALSTGLLAWTYFAGGLAGLGSVLIALGLGGLAGEALHWRWVSAVGLFAFYGFAAAGFFRAGAPALPAPGRRHPGRRWNGCSRVITACPVFFRMDCNPGCLRGMGNWTVDLLAGPKSAIETPPISSGCFTNRLQPGFCLRRGLEMIYLQVGKLR
jgi:hypothetical protein